jgi:hypothetical protein
MGFLMATQDVSLSVALNTSPNPPDPTRLPAEKPLVASISCVKVRRRSWLWKVATLMLSASFSAIFPSFHVVALRVPSCRLLSM